MGVNLSGEQHMIRAASSAPTCPPLANRFFGGMTARGGGTGHRRQAVPKGAVVFKQPGPAPLALIEEINWE